MHDKCYADQKYSHCGIFSPKYTWEMTTRGIICRKFNQYTYEESQTYSCLKI
jgi:hypothetical protein